jgi:hypothetical protein
MPWVTIVLAILTEFPQLIAVLQKWQTLGQTPTVEDLTAELAALDLDDAELRAAYDRLFPGQAPPPQ